jgi:phosphate-selective porin OprO/OprP
MLNKSQGVACMALVAAMLATTAPVAHAAAPSNDELLERIEKLEELLSKKEEADQAQRQRVTVLEDKAKDVEWSFANTRPQIKTGDGRFSLALRGRFQVDMANFMQKDPSAIPTAQIKDLSSGVIIRRAYFGVEGMAFKDFWYEFRMNFGGSNAESPAGDANLNLARIAYTGIPNFRINVGVIQPVFTLGDTVSSGGLMFIERAEIDNIAVGSFGGSDSRRGAELTFQKENLFNDGDNLILSAAYTGGQTGAATGHGGCTNSVTPGGPIIPSNPNSPSADCGEQAQILGRAAYRIWSDGVSNIQIGGSAAKILKVPPATATSLSLNDRPLVRVDGRRLVSATVGSVNNPVVGGTMWGLDAGANFKNFYVAGEYHKYSLDRAIGLSPKFDGFYVEASWVITGEPKVYKVGGKNNEIGSWGPPKVNVPFSPAGGSWGVWELAVRYSQVDLNWNLGNASGIAGGEETAVTVGLNWYLNNNVRLMLNDIIMKVNKLNSPTGTMQVGQKLNTVAARLQFSF